MAMSLEEVRNIRFPMVRKPNEEGYRASAVDNFMDQLEISYAEIVEENEQLRATPAPDTSDQSQALDDARNAQAALSDENEQLRNETQRLGDETNRLNEENASLRQQLDELRSSGDQAATGHQQLMEENGHLRGEIDRLNQELSQAHAAAAAQAQAAQAQTDAPVAAPIAVDADGVSRIEVTTREEANAAVVRLVTLATEQAETLLTDAENESNRRLEDANNEAARIVGEAQNRAQELDKESRDSADRLLGDARIRADRLNAEVSTRREELFTDLENDRDALMERVNQLRDYEGSFRRTFSEFLQNQINHLQGDDLGSSGAPDADAMFGLGTPEVSTPRLDALVRESRQGFDA